MPLNPCWRQKHQAVTCINSPFVTRSQWIVWHVLHVKLRQWIFMIVLPSLEAAQALSVLLVLPLPAPLPMQQKAQPPWFQLICPPASQSVVQKTILLLLAPLKKIVPRVSRIMVHHNRTNPLSSFY